MSENGAVKKFGVGGDIMKYLKKETADKR